MARAAVAQEALYALRREIARIEGIQLERLVPSSAPDGVVLRRGQVDAPAGLLPTGIPAFDRALGGGIVLGALTEIHAGAARDAAAAAGLALGLASLARGTDPDAGPFLWIGAGRIFAESGFPYLPGTACLFGHGPQDLLIARAAKLADALWIAEEAAAIPELSAILLEVEGSPALLDLTATRRLHRRAAVAGIPFFLIRHAAQPQPTAAPLRLLVSPAPATPRVTLAGPLAGSIAHPAFSVTIDKSRAVSSGCYILEWNPHDRAFQQRSSANSRSLVPAPGDRPHPAPAPGAVLAIPRDRQSASAGAESSRRQRPAHRRSGRAG